MFNLEEVDLSRLTESEKSKYHYYIRMQSQSVDITNKFSDKIIESLIKTRKNKISNAIWGFIIGDCLGVPYEFKEKGTFHFKEMKGFGTHNQPPMTWSDDTSLMLSLLDSYEKDTFNIKKQKHNLHKLLDGYYSVDNILFDIGIGTRNAIHSDFTTNTSDSLGNGGLLRCWLLGIIDKEQLSDFTALTHSNDELYMECCNLYISLINNIIEYGKEIGISKWKLDNKSSFDNLIKNNRKLSKTEGCIVQTIRIVISSYINRRSIKYVIELGGDTDSNAALFGALKGAEEDDNLLKYKNHIRSLTKIEQILYSYTSSSK